MLIGVALCYSNAEVLALPEAWHFSQWVGLGVLAVVGWLLYRSGAKAQPSVPVQVK